MYTLAHLSDLHIFSSKDSRPIDFFNKRLFGFLKWRLQRHAEHRNDILQNLVDDLRHKQPDHTMVTGDLVHLGLPDEYLKADDIVRALGNPLDVTIIPGNHDAYISGSIDCGVRAWHNYMQSDENCRQMRNANGNFNIFPVVRIRNEVAIIGVSSAIPCSPLLAVGEIGDVQLRDLAKILKAVGQRGLFRVLMIHHPPVSGVVSWRKRLIDSKAVCSILHQYGVELVIHGHAHKVSNTQLKTQNGPVPVIGVPSASAKGHKPERRARYNIYRIEQHHTQWQINVSTWKLSNNYGICESEAEHKFNIRK